MTRLEPMGAAVAQDRQEVIVQAVRLVPCGGVVFYASVPGNSAASTGCVTRRTENRRWLVTILWKHLFSNRVALPIQLVHDPLGRPHLLVGGLRGPAISFSTAGEEDWAALCGDESDIGIDVAGSAEFREGYPVHRVFHGQELHQALELAGGDLPKAAALLWSVKEAVAKALGCAFHLVDPRDIHVDPTAPEDGGPAFSARLSGKALVRFPMADRRPITVRSLPRAGTWLSIAALNWPRHRGPGTHTGYSIKMTL
ncbi:MAG: 4'-phosphopantetheinyl transferase superfamily protein [Bradyrhizobium sp.]